MTNIFNQNNYLLQVSTGQKEASLPSIKFHNLHIDLSDTQKEELERIIKMFSLETTESTEN